jgi:hypothetical protein
LFLKNKVRSSKIIYIHLHICFLFCSLFILWFKPNASLMCLHLRWGGGEGGRGITARRHCLPSFPPVSRAQGQKNAAKNAKQFVAFTSGHLSGVVVPFLLTHLLTFRAVNKLNRELRKNRFLKVVFRGIKLLLFLNDI